MKYVDYDIYVDSDVVTTIIARSESEALRDFLQSEFHYHDDLEFRCIWEFYAVERDTLI